ncbi:cell wall anchor protein [Paractinoplanes hotanensis]|uniref:Cell wall anchor protein n=1 Tax=Paractinoplanes hotanensis TaxID=2906497 RepID=A0ABT0XSC3_9ACTN|nr:cell wall anchor protein [Actinoplanes hotanensis]MCM4076678.1 cell wall anchor protein [Actinoplanes hotanensis]
MNLLKSKLRRATAVAAGTLIGLAGVAFFASPASAHHSAVKGTAVCDTTTGDWVVDWSVDTDSEGHAEAYRFVRVESTPEGSPVEGIVHTPDDANPVFPHKDGETLKGTQRVDGEAKSASLTVQAKWDNEYTEWEPQTGTVEFDGVCSKDAPKPDAQLVSDCDGVTITLANGAEATADAKFTIIGSEDFKKDVTVKAGEEPATVKVPAENAKKIVVTEASSEEPVLEGEWKQPENCEPEDNASRYFEATCESLIFTIDNTKGTEAITATFTPNKGEPKSLTVKAGDKGSVTFKGEKGLKVTPAENGESGEAIDWDAQKPEDCDATPTPTPTESSPGEGGGLPVTGPVAGSIAGGAALLLAAGAVLFILARRRKVKFTA